MSLDDPPSLRDVLCACGNPATFNGRECPRCARERLAGIGVSLKANYDVDSVPIGEQRARAMDNDRTRRWNRRLEDYRTTRLEGSHPRSTSRADIDAARAISDHTQEPFDARWQA